MYSCVCHGRNINGFDLCTKYFLIQELSITEDKFEIGPDFRGASASQNLSRYLYKQNLFR